ncbi:MAG: hypothetical protein KAI14_06085 [Dehalococcoidales bacterium]|nr:hypothetical protein [Dehalococcoidales bacterium]
MRKKIWNLSPGDIVIIGEKRYKHSRDIQRFMPTLGNQWNREIVSVDDPSDKQRFFRNIEVEIAPPPADDGELPEKEE